MPSPLLQIDRLTKSFGDRVLFFDISFGIAEGDKIGLIAPNGTGKTTLLNIIANKEPYDNGRVVFRNDLRFAYLKQDPQFNPGETVLEACFNTGNDTVDLIAQYEKALFEKNQTGLDELIPQMEQQNAWDFEQRIKRILSRLNITNLQQKIGTLSGGQIKRVALANALISEPELLIMDEPTNHLDLEMVEWLEDLLSRNPISLLIVTHDRYFLDKVCTQIIEIDNKQLFTYKGNYSYYLEKRDERLAIQDAETDKAKNLLRKELDWMRRQPQARGTKAKSRIDAFYSLEETARQYRKDLSIQLSVKGSYTGKKIFEAKNVSKSFGDIKITDNFNYVFSRYEKMGIVGNNGSGKSTFIRMLLGIDPPDKGSFDIGETIQFGYYSQEGLQFDEQTRVIDAVRNIAEVIDLGDGKRLSASQFLQYFLFPPEKQYDFIYKLSGGEKRRLYLCTVLIRNPNFLILDEPTNDLDIMTLNILEEYLANFSGCLIVISHDRYFTDKVVDHLLVFNGNALIKDFPGNYSQYREWKSLNTVKEKEIEKTIHSEKRKSQNSGHDNSLSQKRNSESKKLTFREKKEFETLELEIEKLESEQEELTAQLSSGVLSPDEMMKQSEHLSRLIKIIDEKTMRWLELSERAN